LDDVVPKSEDGEEKEVEEAMEAMEAMEARMGTDVGELAEWGKGDGKAAEFYWQRRESRRVSKSVPRVMEGLMSLRREYENDLDGV
jgi:hypothetical protein